VSRLLALLLALGAPRAAATQAGAIADTIAGTVTGPDGQALVGAIAQATSVTTRVTRRQSTDARGGFTILLPESGGQYQLIVRYFGMVPARLSVVRQLHEGRLAANVRMDLAALPNSIASILSGRDSLRLSAAQAARLRGIADSPASNRLQALERARGVLTAYQWAQLSGALGTPGSRDAASPVGKVQEAAPAPQAPSAQGAAQQQTAPAPQVPSAQRAAQQQAAPPRRAWAVYTGLSNVYDSNLDHSQPGLESYGVLVGLGGWYRYRSSGTTLAAQYDGVFRNYTGTDIWNRPGHDASVSINQRMGPHWALGTEVEALINGSAEDRVLRNEYSAQSQLEYRFNRSNRLLLYGEYLLKRYPTPLASQNAVDPRVGVRFRQLLGPGRTWGVGGRYDYNRADTTRYRFRGWAVTGDVASPLWTGARISSSVRYRVRHYTSRLVELGTTKVLRRDDDWVATITWGQTLARSWEVVLSYQYETYQSNDSRREFLDHLVGLTVNRWW